MKSTKEKAADYFKSNPGVAELFGTSDGTLFLMRQHAVAHSHTLEDQGVDNFTPSDEAPEFQLHIVSQEDLDANPELLEKGVNVGDEIKFEAVKPKEVKKAAAPKVAKVAAAPKAKAAPKAAKATAPKKAVPAPKVEAPVVEAPKAEAPVTGNTPPAE